MIGRVEKQLKGKDMAMELTDKAKSLLAKRGFDPVLGARPLRRTIQREIEDALSEKILFEEVGPGQLVTVDVDNWDGEGAGEDAVFTFTGARQAGQAGRAGPGPGRRRRHANRGHGLGITTAQSNGRSLSGGRPFGIRGPGVWTDCLRCFANNDVIDGRRNLVRVQNGRATVHSQTRRPSSPSDWDAKSRKGHSA